jgi:hypothetical protein
MEVFRRFLFIVENVFEGSSKLLTAIFMLYAMQRRSDEENQRKCVQIEIYYRWQQQRATVAVVKRQIIHLATIYAYWDLRLHLGHFKTCLQLVQSLDRAFLGHYNPNPCLDDISFG